MFGVPSTTSHFAEDNIHSCTIPCIVSLKVKKYNLHATTNINFKYITMANELLLQTRWHGACTFAAGTIHLSKALAFPSHCTANQPILQSKRTEMSIAHPATLTLGGGRLACSLTLSGSTAFSMLSAGPSSPSPLSRTSSRPSSSECRQSHAR